VLPTAERGHDQIGLQLLDGRHRVLVETGALAVFAFEAQVLDRDIGEGTGDLHEADEAPATVHRHLAQGRIEVRCV
jgi:hypothetical protein